MIHTFSTTTFSTSVKRTHRTATIELEHGPQGIPSGFAFRAVCGEAYQSGTLSLLGHEIVAVDCPFCMEAT